MEANVLKVGQQTLRTDTDTIRVGPREVYVVLRCAVCCFVVIYFIVLLISVAYVECAHYSYPAKCSVLVILEINSNI